MTDKKVNDPKQFKLVKTRMAFANLFKAKTFGDSGEGAAKFGASFLLDPVADAAQVKAVQAAMLAAATDKWGAKGKAVYELLNKTDKLALHDGNLKLQYDGFEGMLYVASNNSIRPRLRMRDGVTDVVESDGVLYSGCYVVAYLAAWGQDNKFGKRINCELRGVQFHSDGDAFGAGSVASDGDFEDLGEQGEEGGLND